jgi:hypothetical protein
MATKSKAASKPAAKKAAPKSEPVVVEQATASVDPESGEIVLGFDGKDYKLDQQALLNLRREINDVAAGFVH